MLFTAEHLEALNGWVFQRVPVEEAGIVPAVLEWVTLESQLAYVHVVAARMWLGVPRCHAGAVTMYPNFD